MERSTEHHTGVMISGDAALGKTTSGFDTQVHVTEPQEGAAEGTTKDAPPVRTAENERLAKGTAREENWQRWGTYLPERQWGTVRETTRRMETHGPSRTRWRATGRIAG